jgi:hypothetical protein
MKLGYDNHFEHLTDKVRFYHESAIYLYKHWNTKCLSL